ncbi:hypothetical protein Btru_071860 [Bulinus truncatus]|nr:hypothetical protein Btru_071860 [Bulinus truncatus]
MKCILILLVLVPNVFPGFLSGQDMKLMYAGHSSNKCSKGLLSDIDVIRYSIEIDNTDDNDLFVRILIKLNNVLDFQHLCTLQIRDDCDKHLNSHCICVSGNRSGYYQVNTNFKANMSLNRALIKGELHVDTTIINSNIEVLPDIYDPSANYALLQIDGTPINASDCKLKLNGRFAVLLYRCTKNFPSPCRLQISDVSTDKTLKYDDDDVILYTIVNAERMYLEFSYTICEHPSHTQRFRCTMDSVVSSIDKQ